MILDWLLNCESLDSQFKLILQDLIGLFAAIAILNSLRLA